MAEDLARFQDPRASRFFMRVAVASDRRGGLGHRRRLVAGLSGRVVEVGAGHGPNFALYPPQVTEVIAVEPDASMRAAAAGAAASAGVPVSVVAGHGDSLPLGDGEVDAVVFSLVLCMVPEQARTLAEAVRVLRRGGEVRFYEHVRSPGRVRGLLQDAVTPLVAWRVGCHPNRDTVAAVQAAGLGIDGLSVFGFGPPPVKLRHVIGTAVKPLRVQRLVHDVSAEAPCAGFHKPSPRGPVMPPIPARLVTVVAMASCWVNRPKLGFRVRG
ncbi:MAG TPA: class I SAM-dependent methyltransferase [Streptosporangiaceae bacterium]|jgi:SAM-dependent methyltransferase